MLCCLCVHCYRCTPFKWCFVNMLLVGLVKRLDASWRNKSKSSSDYHHRWHAHDNSRLAEAFDAAQADCESFLAEISAIGMRGDYALALSGK